MRWLKGFAALFGFILLAGTLGLPFLLTSAVGLGFIPPAGLPFFRRGFTGVVLASLALTLAAGCWLFAFPRGCAAVRLDALRRNLTSSQRPILRRWFAFVVMLPLFALLLSPLALAWLGLAAAVTRWGDPAWLAGDAFRLGAFAVGFFWLGFALGKRHAWASRLPFVGRMLAQMQAVFTAWMLPPGG